jgi:hypothetical protein
MAETTCRRSAARLNRSLMRGRVLAIAQAPTSTAGSIADDTKLGLLIMAVAQFFCALPLPKKWVAKKMAA